jgi:flagellum-specific peptidoglycan hydrolase FlgJ
LAQWAIESAFGRAMPKGSNNPFGIKAPLGSAHVSAMTHEVYHGKTVYVSQPFAKFASQGDAFDAHAKLLATSKFYPAFRAARDSEAAAHALVGIYATDPNYGSKLISLMRDNGLYQFDTEVARPPHSQT